MHRLYNLSVRQLLPLCLAILFVSACAQDDSLTRFSPADRALADKLGVHPKVLMTASSLANRSPADIARLLEVNPTATLTDTGAIVFGCSLHPEDNHSHDHHGADAPQQPEQPELQPVPQPPPGRDVWDEKDLSKALRLHSRPAATRKIFLEFTGCITQGTDGWNTYYNISTITTPAYDTDGHTDYFSEAELRDIITIHAGVAEAFASWDVDVTTENPGLDGLERADEEDHHYGIRMCVGGKSDWTGASIGGIATLNSFGWINKPDGPVYRDSFVFSSELTDVDGSINLGYIWKSIAHEVGHTLGLVHKGFIGTTYKKEYYTIPPGSPLWAPVMGVPGRGLFAQWSKGEYPSGIEPSSNFDDELKIINDTLPLLTDEAGSSGEAAKALCTTTTCKSDGLKPGWLQTTVLSRIGMSEEEDWYKLTVAKPEQFRIQLTVHNNYHKSVWSNGAEKKETWRVSNLRPEVKFAGGGVKVTPTSADPWTWQQDFLVTVPKAGEYTFAVLPTRVLNSKGTAMPSSYGNLGSYQMLVVWPGESTTT